MQQQKGISILYEDKTVYSKQEGASLCENINFIKAYSKV